jgi:hypothetical protein
VHDGPQRPQLLAYRLVLGLVQAQASFADVVDEPLGAEPGLDLRRAQAEPGANVRQLLARGLRQPAPGIAQLGDQRVELHETRPVLVFPGPEQVASGALAGGGVAQRPRGVRMLLEQPPDELSELRVAGVVAPQLHREVQLRLDHRRIVLLQVNPVTREQVRAGARLDRGRKHLLQVLGALADRLAYHRGHHPRRVVPETSMRASSICSGCSAAPRASSVSGALAPG